MTATRPSGPPTRRSRRRSPTASAGSTCPSTSASRSPPWRPSARRSRDAGFTAAIVAGMGGSSLAPDVIATAFGDLEDWLAIRVLDSTDPAAVAAAWDGLDPLATLFIVGSKSGTTTETLAFQADAWQRIHDALRAHGVADGVPGRVHGGRHRPREVARGDPPPGRACGASSSTRSRSAAATPPSATSASCPPRSAGIDLDPFMASAVGMHARCMAGDPTANPGVALGVALGALADGRARQADPRRRSRRSARSAPGWSSSIAESTGKLGTGIVPVDREPLGAPGRIRRRPRLRPDRPGGRRAPGARPRRHRRRRAPRRARRRRPPGAALHPHRPDRPRRRVPALGGRDRDRRRSSWTSTRSTSRTSPSRRRTRSASSRSSSATAPSPARSRWRPATGSPSTATRRSASPPATARVVGELRRHLERVRRNGYLAIGAFVAPTAARADAIDRIRGRLRDATGRSRRPGASGRATSTPPASSTRAARRSAGSSSSRATTRPTCRCRGRPYTFGQLVDAQARGDMEALEAHDLPVLRVHLGADVDAGLAALDAALVAEALRQ